MARLLKTGQEVPAETYDDVTVLFTDIVGFTDISSALKPEQVTDSRPCILPYCCCTRRPGALYLWNVRGREREGGLPASIALDKADK